MMFPKDDVVLFGAGGHGRVVASTLLSAGRRVRGFLDDRVSLHGTKVLGIPVLGSLENANDLIACQALVAIGNNKVRRQVALRHGHLDWTNALHTNAWHDPSVDIAEGTVVFAGAVLQPNVRVGRHVIINTGATVDHDGTIGDFVQLCPGVTVAGSVTIEEDAFVGSGATVAPGVTIGARAVVGAGSVVLADVSEDAFVTGVPARPRSYSSERKQNL